MIARRSIPALCELIVWNRSLPPVYGDTPGVVPLSSRAIVTETVSSADDPLAKLRHSDERAASIQSSKPQCLEKQIERRERPARSLHTAVQLAGTEPCEMGLWNGQAARRMNTGLLFCVPSTNTLTGLAQHQFHVASNRGKSRETSVPNNCGVEIMITLSRWTKHLPTPRVSAPICRVRGCEVCLVEDTLCSLHVHQSRDLPTVATVRTDHRVLCQM